MRVGDKVKILADNWVIFGKIGTVLDPRPVEGSTQILVEIDGVHHTLAVHEVEKVEDTPHWLRRIDHQPQDAVHDESEETSGHLPSSGRGTR